MSNSQPSKSPARVGIAQRTDSKGRTQYRGTAFDRRAGKHLRGPWTASLAEARSWRVDALARLQNGTLSADTGPTIREAVEEFVTGIESGAVRTRSGHPYKPSTARGYRRDLRGRVVEAFGPTRIGKLARPDVQHWVDGLNTDERSASTIRNTVAALKALLSWADLRGWVHTDPTRGLRLPAGGEARDRVATPAEAAALVAALPARDQAGLGLAVYGGLRVGELIALDRQAIDLEAGTIDVRRGWDATAREFVAVKNRRPRTVPISGRLATLLRDHFVLSNHPAGEALLFPGHDPRYPILPRQLRRHALKAWKAAKLTPLGFHEARHTFASIAIAAGMNPKTLSAIMGHSSLAITYDIYGHLLPGNEAEAADLLDAYLDASGG